MIYIPENLEDCCEIRDMIGDCINCHYSNFDLLKTGSFPCHEYNKFIKDEVEEE